MNDTPESGREQPPTEVPRRLAGGPRPVSVAVCIATLNRPVFLARTLFSIGAQRFARQPVPRLRVVVVDNDADAPARVVVAAFAAQSPWPVSYLVEPHRGIATARNCSIRHAGDADYIALIDDDEEAAPSWLDELLAHARSSGAAAVLGPVIPRFERPPQAWLLPFFERRQHDEGALVGADDFCSGNVLFCAPILKTVEGPFSSAMDKSGGEDSLLGHQLSARGALFAWASRAIVYETIPTSRTTAAWVLRRSFRCASVLTTIRLRLLGRLRGGALVLLRTGGATALAGVHLLRAATKGRGELLRGVGLCATALGNLAGLLGIQDQEYGCLTHGR